MRVPYSKYFSAASAEKGQTKQKEPPQMQKLQHFRGSFKLERVMGIEPTYPAWEAGVLPLNYTRVYRRACYFTTEGEDMQELLS